MDEEVAEDFGKDTYADICFFFQPFSFQASQIMVAFKEVFKTLKVYLRPICFHCDVQFLIAL